MGRTCLVCNKQYNGNSQSNLEAKDVEALREAGYDCDQRKGSKHHYAHAHCLAKVLLRSACDNRGWFENAFKEFLGISEALQYDDIVRCHGTAVAEPLYSQLSRSGRDEYHSVAFRECSHNRSDDRLDRCSGALLSSLRGTVGSNDMMRVLGCVASANNADVYLKVQHLLDVETYDAEALYEGIQGDWVNGLGGRIYTPWLMDYVRKAQAKRRNLQWAACVWLRDRVVPALKQGAVDKLWQAATKAVDATARNKTVEVEFRKLFGAPAKGVFETVVLRHLSTASAEDPRGPLYYRSHCFRVLDGATERGLDCIVSPTLGTKSVRLRLLLARVQSEGNGELAKYLPPIDGQTIEHRCCERGKLKARVLEHTRRPGRSAEAHRAMLRAYWSRIAPAAPPLPCPPVATPARARRCRDAAALVADVLHDPAALATDRLTPMDLPSTNKRQRKDETWLALQTLCRSMQEKAGGDLSMQADLMEGCGAALRLLETGASATSKLAAAEAAAVLMGIGLALRATGPHTADAPQRLCAKQAWIAGGLPDVTCELLTKVFGRLESGADIHHWAITCFPLSLEFDV